MANAFYEYNIVLNIGTLVAYTLQILPFLFGERERDPF